MLSLLAMLMSLGSLICFIIVLVKMFQTAGVLQGILGLICILWCFIWGWMNAGKLGIKNLMMIWTVLYPVQRTQRHEWRLQLQLRDEISSNCLDSDNKAVQ